MSEELGQHHSSLRHSSSPDYPQGCGTGAQGIQLPSEPLVQSSPNIFRDAARLLSSLVSLACDQRAKSANPWGWWPWKQSHRLVTSPPPRAGHGLLRPWQGTSKAPRCGGHRCELHAMPSLHFSGSRKILAPAAAAKSLRQCILILEPAIRLTRRRG